jgi:hypothetical protein
MAASPRSAPAWLRRSRRSDRDLVVRQLGDFVFDAELLALEIGDSTVVRQGPRILFVDQVLKIGMLGFEFLNALHVGHYRASISQLISARELSYGQRLLLPSRACQSRFRDGDGRLQDVIVNIFE